MLLFGSHGHSHAGDGHSHGDAHVEETGSAHAHSGKDDLHDEGESCSNGGYAQSEDEHNHEHGDEKKVAKAEGAKEKKVILNKNQI
jgi:hypothetical protein